MTKSLYFDGGVKVTLSVPDAAETISRLGLAKGGRAQSLLDSEIIRNCDDYIPFKKGELKRSAVKHTVLGSGLVVWQTPYARRQWYEHKAKSEWAIKMWADHGERIVRNVTREVSGDN
jgi:hypothetical protein